MADLAINVTWNFQLYDDILIVNNGENVELFLKMRVKKLWRLKNKKKMFCMNRSQAVGFNFKNFFMSFTQESCTKCAHLNDTNFRIWDFIINGPNIKNANALWGDLGSRLGYVTNLPYYCSMSINLFLFVKWWTIIPTLSTAYGHCKNQIIYWVWKTLEDKEICKFMELF